MFNYNNPIDEVISLLKLEEIKIDVIHYYLTRSFYREKPYKQGFGARHITMPNRSTDELFQLVKSLQKSEKRNFKLFVRRHASEAELKTVDLFNALEKMKEYDEGELLKKTRSIKKRQLSNLKAQLYKQILSSLRLISGDNNIDIVFNEQMDYARILYNKGLHLQSLKLLERVKEKASSQHQFDFELRALSFEKSIESLHITRSVGNRAEQLAREAAEVSEDIMMTTKLSNLSLELYSWYIKMGHARDEKDVVTLRAFFETNFPNNAGEVKTFYGRLYLYQSRCWYSFIQQDFLQHYRNSHKWVNLFETFPEMKAVEAIHYVKGWHNLLSAHFMLRNVEKFTTSLGQFEKFASSRLACLNTNITIQTFVYLYTAKINKHFMEGTFTKGIKLVPIIEEKLSEYKLQLDRHRVLTFYYKIACLYFGSGENEKAIEYLNKIINWKIDLRTDLQCYARLLHLLAHYELENDVLVESLIKSVYRFMAKMQNLSKIEEAVFKFLRRTLVVPPNQIRGAFSDLRDELRKYEGMRLESRSFMYLDLISWLESKIHNRPVQDVIHEKYLQRIEKR